MRKKTRKEVVRRVPLDPDEDVRFVSSISAQYARRDSRVDSAMRLGKVLFAWTAGRAEAFVVVTDRLVAVVDKDPVTMQPTDKLIAYIPLADVTTQYKRGIMPTVFLWMPDGNGVALTVGLLFVKRADKLASIVGAERI